MTFYKEKCTIIEIYKIVEGSVKMFGLAVKKGRREVQYGRWAILREDREYALEPIVEFLFVHGLHAIPKTMMYCVAECMRESLQGVRVVLIKKYRVLDARTGRSGAARAQLRYHLSESYSTVRDKLKLTFPSIEIPKHFTGIKRFINMMCTLYVLYRK